MGAGIASANWTDIGVAEQVCNAVVAMKSIARNVLARHSFVDEPKDIGVARRWEIAVVWA